MRFAPDVRWRRSRRGLVLGTASGETLLLEHARAGELPDLLADDPDADELARRLGGDTAGTLVVEMTDTGILVEGDGPAAACGSPQDARSVVLTRSGVEFPGIDRPAGWIDRRLSPLWLSTPGRVLLVAVAVVGTVALLAGRPPGPSVSDRPWVDALLGIVVGLVCRALHELAHAVALVGYGRRPRRAGFGFYWGGLSFYVDSTEALTLPRRARVTQALVGLGVDVSTTALLAVLAHLAAPGLVSSVAWRLALLGVLGIVLNTLPILQVDGHWALADLLDEPDLAVRARSALGEALRGRPATPWLVGYGAASIVGGLAMLVVACVAWWAAAGDLAGALFTGSPAEIVVGLLVVGPFVAGLVVSTLGLAVELVGPEADERSGG